MTDAVRALLAETPALQRASRLAPTRLPVLPAFEDVLPFGGLRPGTTVGITGVGATSLGLALVARASQDLWTAAVGVPALGLRAAAELGVFLDRMTVVPDPGDQSTAVLAALVDAFDVIVGSPVHTRDARRISGRVRERDALLVVIGRWPEYDVSLHGSAATWHGIGHGHGSLRSRRLDITVGGRGAASRPTHASLWLPDAEGEVTLARDTVVPMRQTVTA
jgi:hypothetical protein